MKGVIATPSIVNELLSESTEKVFPLGPVPDTEYLLTSKRELSLGSKVLDSEYVDKINFIVVVPGFSEHEANKAKVTTKIAVIKTVFLLLILYLH